MIYIIILLFCFFSFLFKVQERSSLNKLILIFFLFLLCSGYMCGTDWRNYELIYESYNVEGDFWWRMLYTEPLYLLYNALGNIVGLDFWPFFIITKIIICYLFIKTLRKYCPPNIFYFALFFFLAFWGIFMLIDNPMRNVIAVAIFLLSVRYLSEGKFVKYMFIILIATLFHTSAIFMLFAYPLIRNRFSNRMLIVSFVIVNILFINPNFIFLILSKLFSFIPTISIKIEGYSHNALDTTGSGKLFSIGLLVHTLFFILLLSARNKIETLSNGKIIFNIAILFPFIFRLGLTVLIFSRIQLYFSLFYAIAICYSLYALSKRSRPLYVFYVFILTIYSSVSLITADYRYIPYSNYFYCKFWGADLPYSERSDYNELHSPYKNKQIFEKTE